MSDKLEIIRQVLSEVTNEEVNSLTAETDLNRDLDLDSILFVQFLLALEERIPGLEFNQETLSTMAFNTVGDLADHIQGVSLAEAV